MAESKKSTRGSNFIKNFGRAKPDLTGILEWVQSFKAVDPFMATKLKEFFNHQSGVDRKLKFWFCYHKQFPKYTQRMRYETTDFLDQYRNSGPDDMRYPYEGEPSGGADAYFHRDPLTADTFVLPFRIIHTRPITQKDLYRLAEAALAFIDQDDFLGEHFKWEHEPEAISHFGRWDGDLFGIESTTPADKMDEIREEWYIPTNEKGDPFDPKTGMPTVVSESVVRTINWYFKQTDMHREFKVHRIEDIKEQFQTPGWQIRPSLKSYRLKWPVIRNLEEAAEITENNLTGCIENLVTKHLGNEVVHFVRNRIRQEEVKIEAAGYGFDNDYDMVDVLEHWQDKYDRYFAAVRPLGNKAPVEINQPSPEELLQQASLQLSKAEEMNTLNQKLIQEASTFVIESASPLPQQVMKGGNKITSGPAGTDGNAAKVTRTYTEDVNFLNAFSQLSIAIANPIPFDKAKPQIMTKITGSFRYGNGPMVPDDDLVSTHYLGYEQEVEDDDLTYEKLADIATKIAKKHGGGGDEWEITPEMLKWASDDVPIAKKTKIICPDPRTIPANLRK